MSGNRTWAGFLVLPGWIAMAFVFVATSVAAAREATPPNPSPIQAAVAEHFAGQPDYEPGDLISRSQAESLLEVLQRKGLHFADAEAIVAAVPADDDYLAVTLRTPAGRRFMRKIATFPGAYDRLDRLARLPHGKRTIQDLIRGPDGYKMVEYLTTTRGGEATGEMLSHAPRGADFNRPTNRIYTAEALSKQLEASRVAD